MDEISFEGLIAGLCVVVALVFGVAMYAAHQQEQRHQSHLSSLGCQLFHEQETGKKIYCGKACWRREKLQLYTCTNGSRVEIDGRYEGGVN